MNWRTLYRWFPAIVLANSALGLTLAMALSGPAIFLAVWKASVIGDVLFVMGTGATTGAVAWLLRQEDSGVRLMAVPTAFTLNWLFYGLAWIYTGPALDAEAYSAGSAFLMVFQWGWIGLVIPIIAISIMLMSRMRTPRILGEMETY